MYVCKDLLCKPTLCIYLDYINDTLSYVVAIALEGHYQG